MRMYRPPPSTVAAVIIVAIALIKNNAYELDVNTAIIVGSTVNQR